MDMYSVQHGCLVGVYPIRTVHQQEIYRSGVYEF